MLQHNIVLRTVRHRSAQYSRVVQFQSGAHDLVQGVRGGRAGDPGAHRRRGRARAARRAAAQQLQVFRYRQNFLPVYFPNYVCVSLKLTLHG